MTFDLNMELLKVRDQLKFQEVDTTFDMCDFLAHYRQTKFEMKHECGTSACIAGYLFLNNKEFFVEKNALRIYDMILSITSDYNLQEELDNLFYVQFSEHSLHEVTAEVACYAIDNFVRYGQANWDDAFAQAEKNELLTAE